MRIKIEMNSSKLRKKIKKEKNNHHATITERKADYIFVIALLPYLPVEEAENQSYKEALKKKSKEN